MKIPLSSLLMLVFATCSDNLVAQTLLPEISNERSMIGEDVKQAAIEAKVKIDPALLNAFVNAAKSQTLDFNGVYKSVPRDIRITRLARYLSARDSTTEGLTQLSTVRDFQWGYLARDLGYAPVRLETVKEAKLLRIESADGPYEFSSDYGNIRPGGPIVLPEMYMTATFSIDDKKAYWTGRPKVGTLQVVPASTSRGCEIFVISNPSEATVLFNGKEWYARTNTSSVRDPGTWEVIVRRNGYKEWRSQRSLGPGESWTIEAMLSKQ
jgi:PEGA domain